MSQIEALTQCLVLALTAPNDQKAQQELDNEKLRLKNKTLSGDEEAALVRLQTSVLVEEAKVRTIESAKQSRINILLAKEEAAAIKESLTLFLMARL